MIAKMMRRRLLLYSQAAVVLLLFIYLFVSYDSFSSGLDISHYSGQFGVRLQPLTYALGVEH